VIFLKSEALNSIIISKIFYLFPKNFCILHKVKIKTIVIAATVIKAMETSLMSILLNNP